MKSRRAVLLTMGMPRGKLRQDVSSRCETPECEEDGQHGTREMAWQCRTEWMLIQLHTLVVQLHQRMDTLERKKGES